MSSGLLNTGALRHKVTIERKVSVQDPETGDITESWVPFAANIYARIESLSANEFMKAQEIQSKQTGRITIRYRDGIDSSMRITRPGRVYNIVGRLEDNDSGRQWLMIPVAEGVNAG